MPYTSGDLDLNQGINPTPGGIRDYLTALMT